MRLYREHVAHLAKPGMLVALLAIAFLVAQYLGLGEILRRDRLEALIARMGPWGPVVFVGLKILTVVLALPAVPVTFTGGYLFGPLRGTVLNVLAATTGSSLTFLIGRRLGREGVQALLPGRLQDLDARMANRGFWVVLSLRLVPLVPYNGLNYGAGLTRLSFRDYFAGTALGMLPGAAIYTYMGHAASEASAPKLAIGFILLGGLSLLPVFWRRERPSPRVG